MRQNDQHILNDINFFIANRRWPTESVPKWAHNKAKQLDIITEHPRIIIEGLRDVMENTQQENEQLVMASKKDSLSYRILLPLVRFVVWFIQIFTLRYHLWKQMRLIKNSAWCIPNHPNCKNHSVHYYRKIL